MPPTAPGLLLPSPPLGLPVGVAQHGDHLLLAGDFGVLEDAVPDHAGRPRLLAAAEQVGHGLGAALDVGAAQQRRAVAADLLQPPQDQVSLPGGDTDGNRAVGVRHKADQQSGVLCSATCSVLWQEQNTHHLCFLFQGERSSIFPKVLGISTISQHQDLRSDPLEQLLCSGDSLSQLDCHHHHMILATSSWPHLAPW